MLKRLKIGPAIYLLSVSLILLVVAFVLYFGTFNAFGYAHDRFVIAFTIIAMWIIILLIVTDFVDKKRPAYITAIGLLFPFFAMFAMSKLLIPCLSPIGIYFTVVMADTEKFAVAVPRCIAGCAFYVLSIIVFATSFFFKGITHKENN